MLKALAQKPDGTVVLLLGLSAMNIERLTNDDVILLTKADLKAQGADLARIDQIVIFAGSDETQLAALLSNASLGAANTD